MVIMMPRFVSDQQVFSIESSLAPTDIARKLSRFVILLVPPEVLSASVGLSAFTMVNRLSFRGLADPSGLREMSRVHRIVW